MEVKPAAKRACGPRPSRKHCVPGRVGSALRTGAGLILLLARCIAIPTLAAAQVVTGVVTNQATHDPVRGAFVVLVDEAGDRAAGVLTDEGGRYEIRAGAPGTYRLRVEMVGYRSHTSEPFTLKVGERLERSILMEFEPIVLEALEVQAERRRCAGGAWGAGGATAELWEQAERALAAAKMAGEAEPYRFRSTWFRRRLESGTLDILEDSSEVRVLVGTTPFRSLAPEEAARRGFVLDTAGGTAFYAPDLRILISDEFLETHCLSVLAEPPADAPELIGLAFEPVRGRRVPEIHGALWLDRRTAELRWLEYGYVNVPWRLSPDELGGRLEFTRLPNGRWIVSGYRIRTPYLATRRLPFGGFTREQQVVAAIQEEGTRVLDVLDAAGRPTGWMGRGTLQGLVYDSTTGKPLPGATVSLIGTDYRAVSDAAGRFRVPGILPGDYVATFRHPRRDALAYDPPPTPVAVEAGRAHELVMAIPTGVTPPASPVVGANVEVDVQAGRTLPAHVGVWLTGRVVDAETGAPVPGLEVRIADAQQVTDSSGWFRFMDLRPGERRVQFRHIAYGDAEVTLRLAAMRETVVRVKLPARPVAMDEIRVTAKSLEARTRLASGVSVGVVERTDLQELSNRGARVGDVAYRIPGIRVFYGRFYGPGHETMRLSIVCIETTRPFPTMDRGGPAPWCNMVEVYIDGMRINAAGQVLLHADLNQFERIEYVPALGAARWGLRATETGVLLLWTRRR